MKGEKMQNRVFVINKHGEALMPCKPRTARKLLQSGKAKPIKKEPFTFNYYMVQVDISNQLS